MLPVMDELPRSESTLFALMAVSRIRLTFRVKWVSCSSSRSIRESSAPSACSRWEGMSCARAGREEYILAMHPILHSWTLPIVTWTDKRAMKTFLRRPLNSIFFYFDAPNASKVFPNEMPVFLREHDSGAYKVGSYFFGRTMVRLWWGSVEAVMRQWWGCDLSSLTCSNLHHLLRCLVMRCVMCMASFLPGHRLNTIVT